MPSSDPSRQVPTAAEKPLIFISCGQFNAEGIALGKAIEQVVKDNDRLRRVLRRAAEFARGSDVQHPVIA